MNEFGKFLVLMGIILVVLGVLSQFTSLFKLPGDIYIKRDNLSFYFPIVTSIILSIIFTVIINLFFRR